MYEIKSDPQRRIIILKLTGFWDDQEAFAFARDQQAEVRKLGPPSDSHLILADVRNFAVQSQTVSAIIREMVVNAPFKSRRLALVGAAGLARMQVKRVAERGGMRLFTSPAEAERWLLSSVTIIV